MTDPKPSITLDFIVPVRISVSLDGTMGAQASATRADATGDTPQTQESLAPAKYLTRAAEAVRVDSDYSNRNGFITTFLPGVEIGLPTLTGDLANEVAPLRATEPEAVDGELKYEHFSVKLHRTKRIAIFSATNIDGETYLAVDRDTGEVKAAEGDRWFKDPRVSESFTLNQDFYSAWSTYFDRGHLTRRTDPTWGTEEEAKRANADTFHFTNCSPQHFRFNQKAKFWQGVERYVLETGVLAQGVRRALCVFQGPIFDDTIDRYADNVQIPSSYFKVVVWMGKDKFKAVGLVVDQGALLDEARTNLGEPTSPSSVDVKQWRVAINAIEKRTSLNFGDHVRAADTIQQTTQPVVGAEALTGILIRSLSDIAL